MYKFGAFCFFSHSDRGQTMKPTPTPQLIRIPNSALVPTNPLPSGTIAQPINTSDRSESLWEEFLRLQLKPRTRQEYAKAIDYFCCSMAPEKSPALFLQEFLKLPERPAILLVLEWQQRLLDEGKASATINQRIAALKSLVAYAGKNGACGFSLGDIRSLKRQPYKDTRGVAVEDYRSILAQVDRSTDLGIRDYAILRLLWDLALRREEVVSLDIWHYLPGKLLVLGKGKVDRQGLDISEGLAEPLDNWVAIRNGLYFQPKNGERSEALFLSCNGRRLSGDDIYQILRSYGDAAGVKISPHRVRHSAITAFLDASSGDVRSAQSLSRHGDLKTLMIYDDNRQDLQGKASQALGDLLESE
jgi:integrase/recombinase XerC